MSIQLVPTEGLLNELWRRYPEKFVAIFETTSRPLDPSRTTVFARGPLCNSISLCECGKAMLIHQIVNTIRPGEGTY